MGQKPRLPREVFLSHSSVDHALADKLVGELEKHGVRVWYSRKRLRGSQRWADEIGKALARCDWFAVILTPSAVRSTWVKHELQYALRRKRYTDHILPLHFRSCKPEVLSWVLEEFQIIDFRGRFRKGCAELLAVWGLEPVAATSPVRRRARQ